MLCLRTTETHLLGETKLETGGDCKEASRSIELALVPSIRRESRALQNGLFGEKVPTQLP